MAETGVVYAVDDDPAMRDLIDAVLRHAGMTVKTFASADELLKARGVGDHPCHGGCVLLLDLELPGTHGLQVLEEMRNWNSTGVPWPVIVVTARASVGNAVRSMKLGAVDFLEKPFKPEQLVALVQETLAKHRGLVAQSADLTQVRGRLEKLSPRERELLDSIVLGQSTKMIADRLGISARTVDHHRANLMEKMKAENVADLVRMAVQAEYKKLFAT